MQHFNIDIDKPNGFLVLYSKQADSMSRFFSVSLFSGGVEWELPEGSVLTVRFGAPGMPAGWYDTITEPDGGNHSAFSVDGNTVTVELAEQAVSAPGTNIVSLLINGADGYQLASWNFTLQIELVPGLEAPEATVYYNALTEQVSQTLANANAAAASADAAAQSAAEAAASAASVDPSKLVNITGGTEAQIPVITGEGYQWKSLQYFKELLKIVAPIGYIFEWAPTSGSPDLSNAQKVAEYFGFGTWKAYGTGQVLVGVDSGQTEFATVGQTGGEKTHTLTEQELPTISGSFACSAPQNHNSYAFGAFRGESFGESTQAPPAPTGQSANIYGYALSVGGGQAHNNLQPYITVYRWQRIA